MRSAILPTAIPAARSPLLAGVVGLGLLQALTLIGLALVMQDLLAQVVAGEPGAGAQLQSIAVLSLLALLGGLCRWLERAGAERLGNEHVHDVRLALFDTLAGVDSRRGPKTGHGVNMVRFSNDLNALRQWVALGLTRTISASLFLAGVLVATALLATDLALLLSGALLLTMLGIFTLGHGFEHSVRRTRQRRGGLANAVSDVLLNVNHLASFGRTKRERSRLERLSGDLSAALQTRAFWMGALRGFTDFAHRMILLLVLVYGAHAVLNGGMDVAALLAATGVVSLAGAPLRDLCRVFEYWKSATVAREKLSRAMGRNDGNSEQTSVVRLRKGRGRLRLYGVEFIPGSTVLNRRVRPGERIAITGPNGCGKTTLIDAIAGVGPLSAGEITLDGTRTDQLSDQHRRRAIGIASHRVPLMVGSIGKNVRYRNPGARDEAVADATRAAGLDGLLERLPQGIRTRLGTDGAGVSAGEAARIKLARALLGSPRLLLLDEIEQGLDASGYLTFEDLLANYPGTIVFASHDKRLLRAADRVWTLESPAGKPATRGKHTLKIVSNQP
ncbi:MAG: ABC transporter ATP-binding protein [Pseudomonadota bacterium]